MRFFNNGINYSFIKENLALLILIPTIFGGFWQLVELASIGVPYIRFFSVNQLVADGLLILFISSWIYIIITFNFNKTHFPKFTISNKKDVLEDVSSESKKGFIYKDNNEKSSWTSKKDAYMYLTIFSVLYWLITIVAFWPEIMKPVIDFGKTTTFGLVSIAFHISLSIIYFTRIIEVIFDIYYLKINTKSEWISTFLAFALIVTFAFSLVLLKVFHRSFLLPENFKNGQYIKCKVMASNPKIKSYQIEYFNDKYIFISLIDSLKLKSIEVINFESFLNSNACENYINSVNHK